MLKQDSIRIMGQAKYNETLTVKFTNLTKTKRNITANVCLYAKVYCSWSKQMHQIFWDAGQGMKSEVLFSDEHCIVPLDIETDKEVFFDLSEGTITNKKRNEKVH